MTAHARERVYLLPSPFAASPDPDDHAMDASDASDLEKAQPAVPWWRRWQLWPRKTLILWASLGLASLLLLALTIGLAVHFTRAAVPMAKSPSAGVQSSRPVDIDGAVVDGNFADPCYINENNVHYAFATNRFKINQPGQIHVQMATTRDFDAQSWNLTNYDALPDPGPWNTQAFVWAPDVVKLDNGSFVMYYSAQVRDHLHCIGAATSPNVTGPYTPQAQPLVCPTELGGVIDPEGFRDADGTRYLVYKIDANAFDGGHNKTHGTPLMLQKLADDGVTFVGAPLEIMNREESDGPLIEAPSLGRYERLGQPPLYVLFFSSNDFEGPHYDVKYATSEHVTGPYTRASKPLLSTGMGPKNALIGPGGIDVGVSSTQVVFHAIQKGTMGKGALARPMWTAQFAIDDTTLTI